jgi:quercetin dioxygenase-like cupin family protein
MKTKHVRREAKRGAWQGVEILRYKQEGSAPFMDMTRQILFQDPALACELRYFEVGAAGYSTLERHEHTHAVMILHGRGRCLVGDRVYEVGERDLVHIPALTWHQFRAESDAPLGFLCMVNAERDRPQLPTEEDLRELRRNPEVAAFLAS